jgi:predicted RNA-binding Zn-ribbon protein involved in translation (DUF1610 family)
VKLSSDLSSKEPILRGVTVAAAGLAIGFAFYQWQIVIPHMRAFQFTVISITAGIFYAAIKQPAIRNGLAALLVWYVLLTFLIERFDPWHLILNFVYIAVIAVVVYLDVYASGRLPLGGRLQRIAAMLTLTAVGNALIILIIGLILLREALSKPQVLVDSSFFNLKLGGLVGLGLGIGMEIAEYVIAQLSSEVKNSTVRCPSCGEDLELEQAEIESREYTCPACGQKVKL